MKIKTRIIIGFFIIFTTGFYFLFDMVIREIRPRYLEAVEESLNDTANILASLLESEIRDSSMNISSLKSVFSRVIKRKFSAKIFGINKTGVSLHVYVTDERGIVLYDSKNSGNEGKNFSEWNDVLLTLKGKYGARSTRTSKDDPSTSLLYVAAPVKHNGSVKGVVTVIKAQDSVTLFILLAKRKILLTAVISCAAFIILSILLTVWINRPLVKLTAYVNSLREGKRNVLPELRVHELKDLGEAFENLFRELEGRKYIENYIQALTHELKSPLSSIQGAAELLDEDMDREQRGKFCKNISTETKRIDAIIQKLLLLSSIENRKELKDIETINVSRMINDIGESFSPQLKSMSIELENSVNISHNIIGEKFLLRQAVSNLVQNALQFTPENGSIRISTSADESAVKISVSDSGEGIPEYAMDKIFDKFYSLPGRGSGKKSTGLGLSFVKEAALLHDGRIEIKNNVKCGVTATLTIPAA